MGENIVAILHFNGDRAIFLLLWDNQDTEPDLYEIEASISKPISTHNSYQSIYGTYIYILYKIGKNIVVIIHIY